MLRLSVTVPRNPLGPMAGEVGFDRGHAACGDPRHGHGLAPKGLDSERGSKATVSCGWWRNPFAAPKKPMVETIVWCYVAVESYHSRVSDRWCTGNVATIRIEGLLPGSKGKREEHQACLWSLGFLLNPSNMSALAHGTFAPLMFQVSGRKGRSQVLWSVDFDIHAHHW